jgi:hypothetical protein
MDRRFIIAIVLLTLCGGLFSVAQFRRRPSGEGKVHYTEGNVVVDEDTMSTAREVGTHSTDVPMWTNTAGFEKDVFTFCRIVFNSPKRGSTRNLWVTDFPDSDLNLSYRLQQVTSLKVSPEGRFLRLGNKDLHNYPWIYIVEPGRLEFEEEEVGILRRYLLNGGFLMVDDFWGNVQWDNFQEEMKRVFPDRDFVELPMSHPIFHCVFDLGNDKQKLQTPNARQALQSLNPNSDNYGVTWEYYHSDYAVDGAKEMHVRAILDDKGRIMVLSTHNCDNGDGWEREGEGNGDFFHHFSEKRAFPLGINIIFYAMTH